MHSQGFRFFVVAALALLMMIPMTMVSEVIDARANYSRATIASVGREWGGTQNISGPVLIIPVQEEVSQRKTREVTDPDTGIVRRHPVSGDPIMEIYDTSKIENRQPIYIYPSDYHVEIDSQNQIRHRGIFEVPVYNLNKQAEFNFSAGIADSVLINNEEILWDQAEIHITLSSNRALRGQAVLQGDGRKIPLEPFANATGGEGGIYAKIGDPRKIDRFKLQLNLNGAKSFSLAPVGRDNLIKMTSDWPHPSFSGAFLPNSSTVTATGFTAEWNIPHLARALPQVARQSYDIVARSQTSFGVKYFQPNDFYQKAYRAARYGILFIALTFLVVLLLDRGAARPVHPVQFIMIGLVQAMFALLMVAYSEQIGFTPAYLVSSGAVIALLTMYGALALKMGKRTAPLAALLLILYGVLFLILRSADFALLAGSTLAFGALAGTMFLTRNEDWQGPGGKSGGINKFWKKPTEPESS